MMEFTHGFSYGIACGIFTMWNFVSILGRNSIRILFWTKIDMFFIGDKMSITELNLKHFNNRILSQA